MEAVSDRVDVRPGPCGMVAAGPTASAGPAAVLAFLAGALPGALPSVPGRASCARGAAIVTRYRRPFFTPVRRRASGTKGLIRRYPRRCPDPFRSVRALGRAPVGRPLRSGETGSRSSVWLPAWLPSRAAARGTASGFQERT